MACRMVGAKPWREPVLLYCQLGPLEQTSVKFESKHQTFRSWNVVCEMVAILSRGELIKAVFSHGCNEMRN